MDASLRANLAKGTFGVAATPVIRENLMGADRIMGALAKAVDKTVPESAEVTKSVTGAIDKMRALFVEKDAGKLSQDDFAKKIKALEDGILKQAGTLGEKGMEALKDVLEITSKNVKGSSGIEKEFRTYANEVLNAVGRPTAAAEAVKERANVKPISDAQILGETIQSKMASKQIETTQPKTTNVTNNVTGSIKITIDGPVGANGLTQQQLTQIFNSEGFKQYVATLGKDTKGSGVISYQ